MSLAMARVESFVDRGYILQRAGENVFKDGCKDSRSCLVSRRRPLSRNKFAIEQKAETEKKNRDGGGSQPRSNPSDHNAFVLVLRTYINTPNL